MLGLGVYAKLPKLSVKVLHICADLCLKVSVVMILKLLTLGCRCAEEGSARIKQIVSLVGIFFVDQEIFLQQEGSGSIQKIQWNL